MREGPTRRDFVRYRWTCPWCQHENVSGMHRGYLGTPISSSCDQCHAIVTKTVVKKKKKKRP